MEPAASARVCVMGVRAEYSSTYYLLPTELQVSLMPLPRRAVVTGIGVVCPLGLDAASFAEALREGRSGVRTFRSFDASNFPVRIGGEIDGFDARNYLDRKDRKQLKMMVRTIQLAVAGARLALDDGRLDSAALDPARFGVEFGTGTIPGDLADLGAAACASLDTRGMIDLRRWGIDGLPVIPPMWMLNHVPNMPACHVSILHNAQGPNNTITQSDAAGLLALGEAYRILQRDSADVLLAGGADTRTNPISLIRHSLFGRLSRRNEEPEKACRPFERRRDGQVLAEGAGVVVLEEFEHARRRGARIDAEVVGFASSFDRGRTGQGLARAVRAALLEAGVGPNDLDHVNAHACGKVEEDAWEARGLCEALGEARVPVLAVKSAIGNLGTGASIVELAASLLALRTGVMPGTLNQDEPDPACPVLVAREPRTVSKPYVLKVACTEMGQCAALVVRRGE
jgi:3-oxoacyl-[acyl-carrier-protein] synthase II